MKDAVAAFWIKAPAPPVADPMDELEVERTLPVLWHYFIVRACFDGGEPPEVKAVEHELRQGKEWIFGVHVRPGGCPVIVADPENAKFHEYIWLDHFNDPYWRWPAEEEDPEWAQRTAKFLEKWMRTGPIGGDGEFRYHVAPPAAPPGA